MIKKNLKIKIKLFYAFTQKAIVYFSYRFS